MAIFWKYRKIKTCQGNNFYVSSALGGGMADLILQCLVFWFGFRCSSFEKGLYIAFDSSENLQKGPRSAQIPFPRSRVERGRVGGYQGTSGYWKFVSPKSQNEGTGSVGISGGAREVCSPMCSRIFTTSRGSVMKAMIRIGYPHSLQLRGSVS